MRFCPEDLITKVKAKRKLAEDHRNGIWSVMEVAMKYTSPNESSDYSGDEISISDNTKGVYDSTAIIESNKLAKKLINLMFPTSVQYAGLQGSETNTKSDNETIKRYGEIVFKVLELSNLDKELLNYVQNWSTLGTGALRIIYTRDLRMPVSFKQISLKNIYFMEDAYSRPSYVWHINRNMTQDQIIQTWGCGYPELGVGQEKDIIETVYFEKKGGEELYHYIVSDKEYVNIVNYEILPYNPFIITRYKKFANGLNWGCGEAMNCLSNIVNVNYNKKLTRIAGNQSINPALLGYGDQDVISRVKLKLNEVTYMGNQANALALAPQGNPNIEFMTIQEDQLNIKQTFYADFMSGVPTDSGVRTA